MDDIFLIYAKTAIGKDCAKIITHIRIFLYYTPIHKVRTTEYHNIAKQAKNSRICCSGTEIRT